MCVTTETRHLNRPGQLGDFEQDSNTDLELESNTDSHSAQSKAHVGLCVLRRRHGISSNVCPGSFNEVSASRQVTWPLRVQHGMHSSTCRRRTGCVAANAARGANEASTANDAGSVTAVDTAHAANVANTELGASTASASNAAVAVLVAGAVCQCWRPPAVAVLAAGAARQRCGTHSCTALACDVQELQREGKHG